MGLEKISFRLKRARLGPGVYCACTSVLKSAIIKQTIGVIMFKRIYVELVCMYYMGVYTQWEYRIICIYFPE